MKYKFEPKDPNLYSEIKSRIIAEQPKTSAYRSMRIQKEYMAAYELKHNSKDAYVGKNQSSRLGTKRWLKEKWINVREYLLHKKLIPCGTTEETDRYATCRPYYRISAKTPTTIRELLKKGTPKKAMLNAITKKERRPRTRIDWDSLAPSTGSSRSRNRTLRNRRVKKA